MGKILYQKKKHSVGFLLLSPKFWKMYLRYWTLISNLKFGLCLSSGVAETILQFFGNAP